MHILAPFILQNFKKILRADPDLWGCAIFGPKMTHLTWTKIFGTNHYYYFQLPIGPFHCPKFKKILTADSELWGCAIFGLKLVHLLSPPIFLAQTIIITFIYLLVLFIVQNLKKILPWIQSSEDAPFLGPNWSICPK